MIPVATTLVILALAVVAFMSNRVPLGIVAIGVAVALWLTGILDLGAGARRLRRSRRSSSSRRCSSSSEALDATGVTAWAGQQVIARGGTRAAAGCCTVVCLLVAVLTALISVNGAVAALIPVVVVVAARAALPPSQMLHAARVRGARRVDARPDRHARSTSSSATPRRMPGAGRSATSSSRSSACRCVVGTLLVIVAVRPAAAARAHAATLPQDLERHAPTRCARSTRCPRARARRLAARASPRCVVAPRSPLIGLHLFPGMATPSGDLVVLAVQRAGDDSTGPTRPCGPATPCCSAARGTSCSEHTGRRRGARRRRPAAGCAAAVPLGRGREPGDRHPRRDGRAARHRASCPPAIAGLLAACAIVLTRVVLTSAQAYRAISWTTVVLVGGHDPAVDGLHHDRHRRGHREPACSTSSASASPRLALLARVRAHHACSAS